MFCCGLSLAVDMPGQPMAVIPSQYSYTDSVLSDSKSRSRFSATLTKNKKTISPVTVQF
jgi:hypothetical protein